MAILLRFDHLHSALPVVLLPQSDDDVGHLQRPALYAVFYPLWTFRWDFWALWTLWTIPKRSPPNWFSVKIGILSQPPPGPLPESWDSQKGKKKLCLFCILGYSKHIIFSWKSLIFFGDWWFLGDFWWFFGWDWRTPRHIATKSQHLWAVPRQIRFWSILKKSWDWVRPPPLLGPKSQLLPKICFACFPKRLTKCYKIWINSIS